MNPNFAVAKELKEARSAHTTGLGVAKNGKAVGLARRWGADLLGAHGHLSRRVDHRKVRRLTMDAGVPSVERCGLWALVGLVDGGG